MNKIYNDELVVMLNRVVKGMGLEYEIEAIMGMSGEELVVRNNVFNDRIVNLGFDTVEDKFTVITAGTQLDYKEFDTFKEQTLQVMILVDTLNSIL